ncbi:MAG: HAMP domain-containing protein [Chlamydiae bacterium]|nr:HAMP domain-containing protein [Chlamydiota bacterium]
MSIRLKLFIWIFILFVFIFVSSFFLETKIQSSGASKIKDELLSYYNSQKEEKHSYLENILKAAIAYRMSEINSFLELISRFGNIADFFAPNQKNEYYGTWKTSASFLQFKESIDFIQNQHEETIYSLIAPLTKGLTGMFRQDAISEDFCYVYTKENLKDQDPLVGVLLKLNFLQHPGSSRPSGYSSAVYAKNYVLYDKTTLKNLPLKQIKTMLQNQQSDIGLNIPFFGGAYLDLIEFIDRLERVQITLNTTLKDYIDIDKSIDQLPAEEKKACSETLICYLDQRIQYTNELFMIWQLASLIESKVVDLVESSSLFSKGMAFFPSSEPEGQGFFTSQVFADQSFFDAKSYYENIQIQNEKSTENIAIFKHPYRDEVFLGNVAKIGNRGDAEGRKSFLTLGFSVGNVLKNLSLTFQQSAWIIYNNQIINSITSSGSFEKGVAIDTDKLKSLLSSNFGFFEFDNVEYYYIQLTPYPDLDLHVLLFNPAAKEFGLANQVKSNIQLVLKHINNERHLIIALGMLLIAIAVLNLSKKIARPIIAMAKAAQDVKKGDLNNIHIPNLNLGSKNEVEILRNAFVDMVDGLKEKEKMKGVLDKVVSADIAEEILKGDIHLGGEEKEVTIFFADIRDFSGITQKLAPQEIVSLVNTCMTKLAKAIDAHQGVIDKYIGDEIMVLFGAPVSNKKSALDAIKCALEIMKILEEWNLEREKQGIFAVKMGIGIHTGKVLAGNMGAEQRLNYTVIGTNVNLASRLCNQAKEGEILISEDTFNQQSVKDFIQVEDLGALSLKGFEFPQKAYKVVGAR